ncbi:4-carboxymuconolactone decarboxylase [Paracoccus denitrificans PD1222]|uniref:4-carboxymuconolactone decarboxylase n=2 Tax=Paracoccus denitrificans TaxID=266 RepID=A1B742_PARDP|nr:4-carboxymuconolactone decarboxylase [Paracoccus denitrificans PD1222]
MPRQSPAFTRKADRLSGNPTGEHPMDRIETGRQVLRELMGEDFLVQRAGRRNDFNAAVQDYTDDVCFGTVWSPPGIDRKMRSILNIAMLTALCRPNQLRSHVEGAINNGCTVEELREILLHTAVYAGLPAAVEAFKVAEEVLEKKNLL